MGHLHKRIHEAAPARNLPRDAAHGIQDQFGTNTPRENGLFNHLAAKLAKVSLEMKIHRVDWYPFNGNDAMQSLRRRSNGGEEG
jgi:hypothetical protein